MRHPEDDADASTNVSIKKTNPLQAWTGPEGSSRLRLTDFKTIST